MKNILLSYKECVFSTYDLMWSKCMHFTFLLNLCNCCDVILHKTKGFFCIKHEHSQMSFKNNISYDKIHACKDDYILFKEGDIVCNACNTNR